MRKYKHITPSTAHVTGYVIINTSDHMRINFKRQNKWLGPGFGKVKEGMRWHPHKRRIGDTWAKRQTI